MFSFKIKVKLVTMGYRENPLHSWMYTLGVYLHYSVIVAYAAESIKPIQSRRVTTLIQIWERHSENIYTVQGSQKISYFLFTFYLIIVKES